MEKIQEYESRQRAQLLKRRHELLESGIHHVYIYILCIHYDELDSKASLSPYNWNFKVIESDATYIPLVTYHSVNIMNIDEIRQYVSEQQLSDASILQCQREAEKIRDSYKESREIESPSWYDLWCQIDHYPLLFSRNKRALY